MKEEKEELKDKDSTKDRSGITYSSDVVEKMVENLNRASEEKKELEDKYVRLYAEFENHKKRFRSQLNDIKIQTKHSTVKELLNVVDDISLSRKSLTEAEDPKDWVDGAVLIFDKIDSYIKSVGLEEVSCEIGTKFDPDRHDCITVIQMGEDKIGTIVDVIKRGYKIDGKIVKYPQVVVGS
ncbi:MAG: Protein GrpE [uncultured marine phage]|uniref:Protein GrpE n=1 Tax=uncultured marine phage TaxID=707152 RepID=A0A8D9CFR8_9VIRU|nr:MAG: Protein GrpE [uncultured marine phage]